MSWQRPLTVWLLSLFACTPTAQGLSDAPAQSGDEAGGVAPTSIAEAIDPEGLLEFSVEARQAFRQVEEAQNAGFGGGDFNAYMSAWHNDGELVIGRGPEPGSHDVTLRLEQIDRTKRIRFCKLGDRFTQTMTLVGEHKRDGMLVLEVETRSGADGGEELLHEAFWMVPSGARWLIRLNRYYFVHHGPVDDRVVYDDAHWAELDRKSQGLLDQGDALGAFFARAGGGDFAGAVAAARRVDQSGLGDDERSSFRSALQVMFLLTGDAVGAWRIIEDDETITDAEAVAAIDRLCGTQAAP